MSFRFTKKTLLLLAVIITQTACVSSGEPKDLLTVHTEIFEAPFEKVWRAAQQTLVNYPMSVNNMDTGMMATTPIKGLDRFHAPHLRKIKPLPSSYEYRLRIKVLKSRSDKQTRVNITKTAQKRKDFFSSYEEQISDGWEEKKILYRIQREIRVEKILKRTQKRMDRR